MSAQVYYSPFVPAFNSSGAPAPKARLHFFYTETEDDAPIYSDATLTTQLPNYVQADLAGKFPNIYLDSNIAYRVRITDRFDNPLTDDIDPYVPGSVSEASQTLLDAAAAAVAAAASVVGVEEAVEEDAQNAQDAAAAAQAALAGVIAALEGEDLSVPAVIPVANIAALKAVTDTAKVAYLIDAYARGVFVFNFGNMSSQVTSDPDNGLYVPPNSDPDGSSGAWVRQVETLDYQLDWWLRGDSALVQDKLTRAFKLIPAGGKGYLPPRTLTVAKATPGIVLPGSSTVNSGVIGAIYLEKSGQEIIGCGYESHLDGQGDDLNCIMVRASNCAVRNLRAGNVAGQLITNESAGVCFQPKFTAGGTGGNIENLVVEDCFFYNADTGVTGTADADLTTNPQRMWLTKRLNVNRCRLTGIRRQGVEIVADESFVTNCTYVGADKGVYVLSRFVRVIGGRNVTIANNKAIGFDPTNTGYNGVQVETLGFYGNPLFYRISAGVDVHDNDFFNFGAGVQIDDSQEAVNIHDNSIRCEHGSGNSIGVRVLTTGIRNPGYFSAVSGNSYTYVDHGLTVGEEIQSLFTVNGLTFGVTYYAIVIDDDHFQWALTEIDAIAGTEIVLSGADSSSWATLEMLTGLANKLVAEHVSIKSNYFVGIAQAVNASGRVLLFEAEGNTWAANTNTSASGIKLSMTGSHPLENIENGSIRSNTLLSNDVSSGAPIVVEGMKASSLILVDDNQLVPSTSGATISQSGDGVLEAKDAFSNRTISGDIWINYFDPPAGDTFTEFA